MKRAFALITLSLSLLRLDGLAGQNNATGGSPPGAGLRPEQRQKKWEIIPGGAGTSCSDASPYSFFVRPGDPGRLLIYFQGGGACWSPSTCDTRQDLYRHNLTDADVPAQSGIFDFGNRENPFRDYTVVFVPYCTGDAHLGSRTVAYKPSLQVHHKGHANAMAALRWTFANVKSPRAVFVAGGSAGAIASPFYAGRVADHYKGSRIAQLGDSAGGLSVPLVPEFLRGWGAIDVLRGFVQYRRRSPGTINFETLYKVEAWRRPSVVFSQFNNSEDARQIFGLRMFGIEDVTLRQMIERNYSDIGRAVPKFRTFTARGDLHVIMDRPEFYTLAVGTVRLRDWVEALASGRPMQNITAHAGQ